MSFTSLEERRLTLTTLRADVARLMTVAQHNSLKDEIQMAERELWETSHRLSDPQIDSQPLSFSIVDSTLELVSLRLRVVKIAISTNGPDATLIV